MVNKQNRVHAVVRGRVQGVGYRYFALREAQQRHLRGFVMNLPDGSVEVEAQGSEPQLQDYLQTLQRGPFMASVSNIDVEWLDPVDHHREFYIRA